MSITAIHLHCCQKGLRKTYKENLFFFLIFSNFGEIKKMYCSPEGHKKSIPTNLEKWVLSEFQNLQIFKSYNYLFGYSCNIKKVIIIPVSGEKCNLTFLHLSGWDVQFLPSFLDQCLLLWLTSWKYFKLLLCYLSHFGVWVPMFAYVTTGSPTFSSHLFSFEQLDQAHDSFSNLERTFQLPPFILRENMLRAVQ